MDIFKYILKFLTAGGLWRYLPIAREIRAKSGGCIPLIMADMLWCSLRHGTGPTEYRILEYWNVPAKRRSNMMTMLRNRRIIRRLNARALYPLFAHKPAFNRAFAQLLHRGWIDASTVSIDEFIAAVTSWEKWDILVCKPPDDMGGHGIEFITVADINSLSGIYNHIREQGNTTVEQYIVQHEAVSRINPVAINTVRMVTITENGRVHLPFCCMRFGLDKQVDNLSSGGLAVRADPHTGVLTSPGCNRNNDIFTNHPATNQPIKGFIIPFFAEAKAFVARAAIIEPRIAYAAWDIAITPGGPLLIEGNCFPGYCLYHLPGQTDNGKLEIYKRFKAILTGKYDEYCIS